MPQSPVSQLSWRQLKSQPLGFKVLLIAVFLFGAGSLIYGGYSIFQGIVTPFTLGGPTADAIIKEIVPQPQVTGLPYPGFPSKTVDTDGDGLSDWDEVNIYSTSPYLADTDGDGIPDGTEIKNGTDPNCPKGQVCNGVRLVTPDTKISDIFPQFSTSNITLKDKTLQEFRQILLSQGMDKASLDKISDTALLVMLEESLKVQDAAQSTSTPASSDAISVADYDKLRQLLISMGVPADEVNSMSNQDVENLLKTFK